MHFDEVSRTVPSAVLSDPVNISFAVLCRETVTGELLASVGFSKNTEEEVTGISAALYLKDREGNLLAGPVIEVCEGTEEELFTKEYTILLPDMEAAVMEAYAERVTFRDGRNWENRALPEEEAVLTLTEPGEEKERRVEVKAEKPVEEKVPEVAAEIPAVPKEKKRLSPKAKKIIGFSAGGVAGAAALAALVIFVVIPAVKYSNAGKLMDAGSYREAAAIYAELDDYRLSAERRNLSNSLGQITDGNVEGGIANILARGMAVSVDYAPGGGAFTDAKRTASKQYAGGETYEGLPEMKKDYYDFTGWDVTSTSYQETEKVLSASVGLTARYVPVEYAITYGGLKDGTHANPASYNVETPAITLADGKRKGYTFTGWSGGTLSGKQSSPVIPTGSHGDLAFSANWEADSYTLSLKGNGEKAAGGKAFKDQTVKVTYDASYSLPKMEKTGFDFAGWSDGKETYLKGTWKKDSDLDLTPVFELHKYSLTYELGGGELEGTNPENYTVEQPDITLSGASRFGYDFLGWTWDGQETPKDPAVLKKGSSGDKVITANWKGHEHTVTMDPNGGYLENKTYTVVFGDSYSIPTPGKTGYNFTGWSDGKTTYTKGVWDLDEDISVKAGWSAKTFTVPLNYNGGSGGAASIQVTYDKGYSLPDTQRTGYDFLGWYIGEEQVTGGTWTIDGAPTISAKWKPRVYTVSLNTDGGDISSSRVSVTFGESYSLPTPKKTGYTFTGWKNGYSSFSASGVWNSPNDVSLTAGWKRAEYTLKVDTDGGTYYGSKKQTLYFGERYTLYTPYKAGYTFMGWEYNGEEFPESGYYDYTKSITVTAVWAK